MYMHECIKCHSKCCFHVPRDFEITARCHDGHDWIDILGFLDTYSNWSLRHTRYKLKCLHEQIKLHYLHSDGQSERFDLCAVCTGFFLDDILKCW